MTIAEKLAEIRELLSDPGRWVRDTLAVDAAGNGTGPLSERAVAWSVGGAVIKVQDPGCELLRHLHRAAAGSLSRFEATHSHAEVLEMLDRAIADVDEPLPARKVEARAGRWRSGPYDGRVYDPMAI